MIVGLLALVDLERRERVLRRSRSRCSTLDDGTHGARRDPRARGDPRPATGLRTGAMRIRVRTGNRDVTGADFRWIDEVADHRARRRRPTPCCSSASSGATSTASRRELVAQGDVVGERARGDPRRRSRRCTQEKLALRARIRDIERGPIGDLNHAIEQRAARRSAGSSSRLAAPSAPSARRSRRARRSWRRATPSTSTSSRRCARSSRTASCGSRPRTARRTRVPIGQIVRAVQPNALGTGGKLALYADRVVGVRLRRAARVEHRGRHLPGDLRHRDDGVPDVALRGAVRRRRGDLPARVRARGLAHARRCASRSTISRACPRSSSASSASASSSTASAATIDRFFFAESLPTPTFGTGGILWASLTLALLTVPVVIVATEEGLAAVPQMVRAGLARARRDAVRDAAGAWCCPPPRRAC